MIRLLSVFILIAVCQTTSWASANLSDYTDVNGTRVYRDHKKKDVFYPAPAPPVLAKDENGTPSVSLDIFRYHGRKGTGDSGEFRVRGVLNIGITRERDKKALKQIKSRLKKDYRIKYPKLRSIPVSQTQGRILFSDHELNWSQPSRWSGKQIALSLDETMGEILWKAVEAGQTQVSVELAENLSGVHQNKDDEWEEISTISAVTLPITLDMKAHPELFSRTDLGGRMVKGYTGIDIFCFDFIENLDETLYSKIVEVAIPTLGSPLVETVTFRQDSAYRSRIAFKLAKDLDTAYKVRITKIYDDGTQQTGAWEKRKGEAMLDITDYKDTQTNPDLTE